MTYSRILTALGACLFTLALFLASVAASDPERAFTPPPPPSHVVTPEPTGGEQAAESATHSAPFARFPIGEARSVTFEPGELLAEADVLQRRNQYRDWLLYLVVADAAPSQEALLAALHDIPPLRRMSLTSIASYDYTETRSRLIADGTVLALVPAAADDATRRAQLARIADEHYKNTGQRPATVVPFAYSLDDRGPGATLVRLGNVSGDDLFSAAYGFLSTTVASISDLERFLAASDDLTAVELTDSGLRMAGRSYADHHVPKMTLDDVAALWQADRKLSPRRAELSAFQEECVDRPLTPSAHAACQIRQRALGASPADSGFSLDPSYDFAKLKAAWVSLGDDLREAGVDEETFDAVSEAIDDSDPDPFVEVWSAVRGPLRKKLFRAQAAATFQEARYDGPLAGTAVGMTLFYTDLLAKLWAIDFAHHAPTRQIRDMVPIANRSVEPIYERESKALPSTRLWFGTNDAGFQKDAAALRFSHISTRVFAKSQSLLGNEEESEAAMDSATFINWWNDNYERIAQFEPQYERLNAIMKWSAVVRWLADRAASSRLGFLSAVKPHDKAWFPSWASTQPLRFSAWQEIRFYPQGHGDAPAETLQTLLSESPISMMSGGVSLAEGKTFTRRAVMSTEVPPSWRRSAIDYGSFERGAARGVTSYRTAEETLFRLEASTGRVQITPRAAAHLRDPASESATATFALDFRPRAGGLVTRVLAGDSPIAELSIASRGNAFHVAFKGLEREQAVQLARRTLPGPGAARSIRDSGLAKAVIETPEGDTWVMLRDSDRWIRMHNQEVTEKVESSLRATAPDGTQWDIDTTGLPAADALGAGELVVVRQAAKGGKTLHLEVVARGPPNAKAVTVDVLDTPVRALRDPASGATFLRRGDLPPEALANPQTLADGGVRSVAVEELARRDYPTLLEALLRDPIAFGGRLETGRSRLLTAAADDIAKGNVSSARRHLANLETAFGADADTRLLRTLDRLASGNPIRGVEEFATHGTLRGDTPLLSAIEARLKDPTLDAAQRADLERFRELVFAILNDPRHTYRTVVAPGQPGRFDFMTRLIAHLEPKRLPPHEVRARVAYIEVGSSLDQPGMTVERAVDQMTADPNLAAAFAVPDRVLARTRPSMIEQVSTQRTYRRLPSASSAAPRWRNGPQPQCPPGEPLLPECRDEVVLIGRAA